VRKYARVYVLGCGPAGLFAAHAAVEARTPFRIYSRSRQSQIFGAQYLHAPIPGISGPANRFAVTYLLLGTIADYRAKVYGPGSTAITSPEKLLGQHPAWDIRQAYQEAWDRYSRFIEDMEFKSAIGIEALRQNAPRRTLVVSSLPAPLLCLRPDIHRFESARIWASGDAPDLGYYCPVTVNTNEVVCNGEASPRWYRASNINGWRSVEWPAGVKPPYEHVSEISKPTWTNCDCLPGILRVGRYGTWTKGELSHQAYTKVREALQ